MNSARSSHFFALGASLTLLLASLTASAQESQEPRSRPIRPAIGRAGLPNKYLVIPGLEPLSLESVQQEIGLTADQRSQLKELSDSFVAEMRQQQATMQREMQAMRDQPDADQEKKAMAMQQQLNHLAQNTKRNAETILSREQLRAIREIAFRLFVAANLANPSSQQRLGLDAQQQQQLMVIYEKSAEQLHKIQRETADHLLKTLTADQKAQLREDMEKPRQRQ